MPISVSESGLTQEQYEALQDIQDSYLFQIVAERQNLEFSLLSSGGGSASGYIDAIVLDGYVFRTVDSAVIRVTLTDGTVSTVSPSAPSGRTPLSTYSLATNGSTLYIFAATATGVQMNSTANYGSSWAGWSTIWSTSDQTIYSGNLARDGVASASSHYVIGQFDYVAANAFDIPLGNTFNETWYTPVGTTTGWLSYDLGVGVTKVVTRYTVTAGGGVGGSSAPKDWTFEGSNNNSSWTVLDTQTSQTGWNVLHETRAYTFSNSTAYRYYRINITANGGVSTQLWVDELTFHSTLTDEAVILVAAANYQRVHFIYVDGAKKVYYPRVLEYTGSWVMTDSTMPLTDRPYNLSVATQGLTDILLLETIVAGRVVNVLSDTDLVSKRLKSGGLIVFHYKTDANMWSTHYKVDVFDELNAYTFMRYSHIENLNGTLHVTAWVGSGTADHPLTGFYDYTSIDGIHWSTRNRIYMGATQSTYGVVLLQSGEYVYAVEYGQVWRSLSTSYTGYVATSLSEDITDYISEWNLTQNDMASITFLLDNADGYFSNHTFISATNKLQFKLKFGSYVDGVELLYQLGVFEMDTFGTGETIPEHMIQVSARDYLARMVEKAAASESHVYESYLLGMDNYAPKTDKNYGGLSHVYTVSGQVDNGNNISALMQNGFGLGFTTFAEDIWNGEISAGILITGANGSAGVVFRAKSTDVYWYLLYTTAFDKVQLFYNNKGAYYNSIVPLWESGTLGWAATAASAYHYLRVRFLYGEIKIFTSPDNITWTLQTTYVINFQFKQDYDNGVYSDPVTYYDPCERGSVGFLGNNGGNGGSYILFYRLNDFALPLTVEDAFQTYASFAGIHDTTFNNLLKSCDDAWSSPTSVIADTGMTTGYYDVDVYDGAVYG